MEFFKKKPKTSSGGCQQLLIRVARILSSEPKIKEERIEISTRFREDFGIDSFDEIFIVMALEKEFGIEIPDEAAEKFLTVKDIVEYLCRALKQEGHSTIFKHEKKFTVKEEKSGEGVPCNLKEEGEDGKA